MFFLIRSIRERPHPNPLLRGEGAKSRFIPAVAGLNRIFQDASE